jgi:hypothetical protein
LIRPSTISRRSTKAVCAMKKRFDSP